MARIIDGKILAEKIKDKIVKEIIELNGGHPEQALARPNLAIILVGERENSKIYVALKEREAKKVGIDTHLYKCGKDISESELLELIKCLNEDKSIDAILVQLPLPGAVDTDTIIMAVDPSKDVDGFQPDNLEKLLKNCPSRSPRLRRVEAGRRLAEADDFKGLMPPVFAAVLEMLKSIDCNIKNKQVGVVANSDIFGKSLAHVLKCQGAKVLTLKSEDKDLKIKTVLADVLITAVGKPEFIKKDMIKDQAIIIDIGITMQNGQAVGDVDFKDVKDRAGYITPVPGGVGPMTIALALKNTLEIYKKKHT